MLPLKPSPNSPFGKRPSFSYASYDNWDITPQKLLARLTVNGVPKYIPPTDPNHGQRCIEPHRLIRTPGDTAKHYVSPPSGINAPNAAFRDRPVAVSPPTMEVEVPKESFSWEDAVRAHVSGEVPFNYVSDETLASIDHHLRQTHGSQLAESIGLDYDTAKRISTLNMSRLGDNQLRSITGDQLDGYLPMGNAFFASREMVASFVDSREKPPMLVVQPTPDPSNRLLLVDGR